MNKQPLIGCSGFAVGFWKGLFYPENMPSRDYLSFYSKHLNAVEINSTFYRRPRPSTILKWVEETEDHFKFFIKIPKTITHLKKLDDTKSEVAEFCQYLAENLGAKLAGFLFQVPPSLHYTADNLAKLITTVDENYLNVVEFRHHSWWNPEIQNFLKEKNIIFAGVSIPKDIPDNFIINNDDFAYYRLHGNPEMFKSEYTEAELQKLAAEILKFKGIAYIFFNNTYGPAAIKNALYLQEFLNGIDEDRYQL